MLLLPKKLCKLFLLFGLFFSLRVTAQEAFTKSIRWQKLSNALQYAEVDAPLKSDISDSKLSLLKIVPSQADFLMYLATANNNQKFNAKEWADTQGLNVVINASMYDVSNGLISRGYLKNKHHENNANYKESYNAAIAFDPVNKQNKKFKIADLTCESFEKLKQDYHCVAQGMRMIDCNGNALGWNKRKQSCSMLVASEDSIGNIYLIFSRSPYTHNQMIAFIQGLDLNIKTTIYLEGGPETSLFIKQDKLEIEKIGSYISESYPNDNNNHFWKLPNLIGIKSLNEN